MRRRDLGSLLAAASGVTASSASFGPSPSKVWRIGVLYPRTKPAPGTRSVHTRFFEALRDLGYVDGRNIAAQWQLADNDLQPFPELAALLVKPCSIDCHPCSGPRVPQALDITIPPAIMVQATRVIE